MTKSASLAEVEEKTALGLEFTVSIKDASQHELTGVELAECRKAAMSGLGIEPSIFEKMVSAASAHNCLLWIRSTNPGVLEGFVEGEHVTGKTLHTKGKSSEYPPVKANLAFFSSLSKSAVREAANPNWPALAGEQDKLIDVVLGTSEQELHNNQVYPGQLFIPKIVPLKRVCTLLHIAEEKTPQWILVTVTRGYVSKVSMGRMPVTTSAELQDTSRVEADGEPWYLNGDGQPILEANAKPAVDAAEAAHEVLKFLWVNSGDLKQVTEQFQKEMEGLKPSFKDRDVEGKGKAGDAWKFDGLLVAYNTAGPKDAYCRLYFDAGTVAQMNQPANYWTDTAKPLRAAALSLFAPKLSGVTLTGALAGKEGQYRAMSVLGQLKIARSEAGAQAVVEARARAANVEATRRAAIEYFEIVADYDVFCIAPSLSEVQAHILSLQGEKPIHPADYYFPKFDPDRGLIAGFEKAVRGTMNDAMQKLDWYKALLDRSTEVVLHGCEVNNYFYTEKFDDLIFITPTSANEKRCPQFRASTVSFLDALSTRQYQLPQRTVSYAVGAVSKSGDLPEIKVPNSSISWLWLPQFNLKWGRRAAVELLEEWKKPGSGLGAPKSSADYFYDAADKLKLTRPTAANEHDFEDQVANYCSKRLLESRFTALLGGPFQAERPGDMSVTALARAQASRLWFYAGWYTNVYFELGRACAASLPKAQKDQVKAVAKLAEARRNIRNAVGQVETAMQALRNWVHCWPKVDQLNLAELQRIEPNIDGLVIGGVVNGVVEELNTHIRQQLSVDPLADDTLQSLASRELGHRLASGSPLSWPSIFRLPLKLVWVKNEQGEFKRLLSERLGKANIVKSMKPAPNRETVEKLSNSIAKYLFDGPWKLPDDDMASRAQLASLSPDEKEENYFYVRAVRREIEKIYRVILVWRKEIESVADKDLPKEAMEKLGLHAELPARPASAPGGRAAARMQALRDRPQSASAASGH